MPNNQPPAPITASAANTDKLLSIWKLLELTKKVTPDTEYDKKALQILQEHTYEFVEKMFESAFELAAHRKSETVAPTDVLFAERYGGVDTSNVIAELQREGRK